MHRSPRPRLAPIARALLGTALLCATADVASAESLVVTVEKTSAPGHRALVRVRSDEKGLVTLRAYRVEEPLRLLDAGLDLGRGEDVAARLAGALAAVRPADAAAGPRAPAAGAVEGETRLSFVGSARAEVAAAGTTVEVDVPLPLPGLYVIEASGREATAVATALSSRLALVVKRHPEGCLGWVVDRTTGVPVQNVSVEARTGGRPVAAATTDERGMAPLAFRSVGSYEVRAVLGEDLAFGHDLYVPSTVEDRRVYAFPNQPAYRPGERVEAKGVVRAFRDGRHVLDPDATEAVVRFVAPGDRELGRATVPVSPDLGTFSAGLDLPADSPTGLCALVAEVGGRSYEAPFRVDAYRRPTFEVVAKATTPRVLVGEEAAFDVAASFYEGGPVAGAPLAWSVVYQRVDRDLFPTDELVRLFFGAEREAYAPQVLSQGTVALDAGGRARVVVRAPVVPEDGHLILQATVTGPDRTVVAGSGSLPLLVSPLAVALKTDKHVYGAEGVARVTVRATAADGSPAAGRAGVLSVAISGVGPDGLPEERDPETIPFTTGPDGQVALDVPFSQNGRHSLAAAMPRLPTEPPGPPAHDAVVVWVVGERADVGFSGDRVEIVADKDAYAPGETARLLVLSPVGGRPALVTGEGARLLSATTLDLASDGGGAAAVFEVLVSEDHAPNVFVGAAVFDQGNLLSSVRMLRVPPVAGLLRAEVTAERTEFEPGSSVPVSVRVIDAEGRPVADAEVTVAVVDDALHALHRDPAVPIEAFFHPLRRNDVRTTGPVDHVSVGFRRTARKVPEVARLGAVAGDAASPAPRPPTSEAPPPSPRSPAPLGGVTNGEDDAPAEGGVRSGAEFEEAQGGAGKKDSKHGGEGPLTPRADFRASVAWFPAARTGADGVATLGPVKFADSLTRWRIVARVVDARTRVGSGEATVRAHRRLLTRVTLPRFLRAGDRVEAPWLLRNLADAPAKVDAIAMATGVAIESQNRASERLAPGATSVRDLSVRALRAGAGVVSAEARSETAADAVRHEVPVLPQGIPRTVTVRAVVPASGGTLPTLSLPPTAERGTARLRIDVAPSLAQAVGAALPYLADYPYGCTEQTMSRFWPAAVARRAMDRVNVPSRGLVAEVPKMVDAGVARLRALQHRDGGFGWWESDASDVGMTAYVLHGLHTAGLEGADAEVAERATAWLAARLEGRRLSEEAPEDPAARAPVDPATYAFACLALAEAGRLSPGVLPRAVADGVTATPPVVRAFLLRATHLSRGDPSDVALHARDLLVAAQRGPDGVHWPAGAAGEPARPTRWSEDDVETTAWVLALAGESLPDDVLEGGARWLLAQRVGERWKSTRDTAACVAFLAGQVARTGERGVGRTAVVSMNGLAVGRLSFRPADAFTEAGTVRVPESELPKGPISVAVAPQGGDAWVSASLSFTETGPAIETASNGLSVARRWWRLVPRPGTDRVTYEAVPWTETVPSGTLVESEVEVTTSEDREFVLVEDPHVAGFEPHRDVATPVEGRPPARDADHVDRFDDRTVFFVRRLAAGTHVFRHRLRAVHAGAYTALPARAELMYFPDVSGNSGGEAVEVSKAGPAGEAGGGR